MKVFWVKYLLASASFLLISMAHGQGANTVLATVNGVKITSTQLDQYVSLASSQGAKDSPELRQNFLKDLVVREAIAQDAKKTGLLLKGNNALKLKIAEQDALMGLWFSQYFAEHPVSEAEIKEVYEKQAALSKNPINAKEYQISQIVLPNAVEAQDIIAQLKGGASFDNLAKNRSIDRATAQNQGYVGWILPSQLAPPMNNLVIGLSKGDVVAKPIQVGPAWYIVRVIDIKPFVMPVFEEARGNIAQAILQQRRQEAVNSLLQNSKISKTP